MNLLKLAQAKNYGEGTSDSAAKRRKHSSRGFLAMLGRLIAKAKNSDTVKMSDGTRYHVDAKGTWRRIKVVQSSTVKHHNNSARRRAA